MPATDRGANRRSGGEKGAPECSAMQEGGGCDPSLCGGAKKQPLRPMKSWTGLRDEGLVKDEDGSCLLAGMRHLGLTPTEQSCVDRCTTKSRSLPIWNMPGSANLSGGI